MRFAPAVLTPFYAGIAVQLLRQCKALRAYLESGASAADEGERPVSPWLLLTSHGGGGVLVSVMGTGFCTGEGGLEENCERERERVGLRFSERPTNARV